jgi:hypothetical protein
MQAKASDLARAGLTVRATIVANRKWRKHMPLEFMDMPVKPTPGFRQALLSNANPESVLNRCACTPSGIDRVP